MSGTKFKILLNYPKSNKKILETKKTFNYIYEFFIEDDKSLKCLEESKFYLMCGIYSGSVLEIFGEIINKIIKGKGSVKVILGLDGGLPDKTSIEKLVELIGTTNVRVFNSNNNLNNGIFHPKVYILEKGAKGVLIVGSSNFTGAAFTTNYEFNVALEFNLNNDKDSRTFNYIKYIYRENFEDFSLIIDDEFIEKLPEKMEFIENFVYNENKKKLFEKLKKNENADESESSGQDLQSRDGNTKPSFVKFNIMDESNNPVQKAFIEVFMKNSEETIIVKTNKDGKAIIEIPENMQIKKILIYAKKFSPEVLNIKGNEEKSISLKKFTKINERKLTIPVIIKALESLTKNNKRWVHRYEIIERIFYNDDILYCLGIRKIKNIRNIKARGYNIKQIGNMIDWFSSNYTIYMHNPRNNKTKNISKVIAEYIQEACNRWTQSEDQPRKYKRR